ncbi:hypothetical protein [Sphaerisporangium dianthi]|uniref:Uncharacterized protein n=1 Tax=Sphaerisporangium dianthi TaxID=1436120 RepID=A0ABV9CQ32_9ACTN
MNGPQVTVEVILLRFDDRGWAYRRSTAPLDGTTVPCDLARTLAGRPALLHSTSWRHTPGHGLILTYAAYPDSAPAAPATPLDELTIAFGDRPDAPSPAEVTTDHVAAHAIRHLAHLAGGDPVAGVAIASDEPLAAMLGQVPAELAGKI